jgi:hypothetical protein
VRGRRGARPPGRGNEPPRGADPGAAGLSRRQGRDAGRGVVGLPGAMRGHGARRASRRRGRSAGAQGRGVGGKPPEARARGGGGGEPPGGARRREEGRALGRRKGREMGRERGRGRGELTSGSKSGDHRLQNLGHHGEREVEERRLLRGRIE